MKRSILAILLIPALLNAQQAGTLPGGGGPGAYPSVSSTSANWTSADVNKTFILL